MLHLTDKDQETLMKEHMNVMNLYVEPASRSGVEGLMENKGPCLAPFKGCSTPGKAGIVAVGQRNVLASQLLDELTVNRAREYWTHLTVTEEPPQESGHLYKEMAFEYGSGEHPTEL